MTGPFLLMQLCDSAFPTGGFAHSGGLEALSQQGEVRSPEELSSFVRQAVWQAGRGLLPFVGAAHGQPGELGPLDARCGAMLTGHVTQKASRTQGRALLETASRVFDHPGLSLLSEARRSGVIAPHLAPTFGAVCALVGLAREECQAAFLYQTARGLLSAAVRLGLVGPHEAQRMQVHAAPLLDEVLAACARLGPEDARQTAPLIELFANTHDRLYSRLFLT
jgi:urease accessory protein